eukprot:5331643-Pleurochrysis_carterae.AAC.1
MSACFACLRDLLASARNAARCSTLRRAMSFAATDDSIEPDGKKSLPSRLSRPLRTALASAPINRLLWHLP